MPSASVAEREKRRDATVEKLNRPSVFSSCNFRTPERCAVVGLRRVKLAVTSGSRQYERRRTWWDLGSRHHGIDSAGGRSRYHVRIRMVNAWEYIADATDG